MLIVSGAFAAAQQQYIDNLKKSLLNTVESGVWRYDGHSMKNFTKKDGLDGDLIGLFTKAKQVNCGLEKVPMVFIVSMSILLNENIN